jgi:hypothetical protein
MKKQLPGFIIGIFIGVISTFLIIFLSFIPHDFVRVTVINKSHHNIKQVILTHEQGRYYAEGIKMNDKVILLFHNLGENSYELKVILDNDSVLVSGNYVESGYEIDEIVTDKVIKQKFEHY